MASLGRLERIIHFESVLLLLLLFCCWFCLSFLLFLFSCWGRGEGRGDYLFPIEGGDGDRGRWWLLLLLLFVNQ